MVPLNSIHLGSFPQLLKCSIELSTIKQFRELPERFQVRMQETTFLLHLYICIFYSNSNLPRKTLIETKSTT